MSTSSTPPSSTPSTTSVTSTSSYPQPVPTIPTNFLSHPFSIPCTRTSLLWGIGTGSTVGVLAGLRSSGTTQQRQFRGLAFGAVSTLMVSVGSWMYCRRAFNLKTRQLEQFIDVTSRPIPTDKLEQLKNSNILVPAEITTVVETATTTGTATGTATTPTTTTRIDTSNKK